LRARARVDRSQTSGDARASRNTSRISFPRFAQKSGFGERRCDAKSPRMKIFSLPKSATQSPRNAVSSGIDESQRGV
jgi:hypothetical protein